MSYPWGYDTPNRPIRLGLCLVRQRGILPWTGRPSRSQSSLGNNNPGPVGQVERPQIPAGFDWLSGRDRGIGVGVDYPVSGMSLRLKRSSPRHRRVASGNLHASPSGRGNKKRRDQRPCGRRFPTPQLDRRRAIPWDRPSERRRRGPSRSRATSGSCTARCGFATRPPESARPSLPR